MKSIYHKGKNNKGNQAHNKQRASENLSNVRPIVNELAEKPRIDDKIEHLKKVITNNHLLMISLQSSIKWWTVFGFNYLFRIKVARMNVEALRIEGAAPHRADTLKSYQLRITEYEVKFTRWLKEAEINFDTVYAFAKKHKNTSESLAHVVNGWKKEIREKHPRQFVAFYFALRRELERDATLKVSEIISKIPDKKAVEVKDGRVVPIDEAKEK